MQPLLAYEPFIRLGVFAGMLALMALLEALLPRRTRRMDRLIRWPGNFAIVLIDTFVLRLLFPVASVGFALLMTERQTGLFNQFNIPAEIAIVASMLLLDLTIYAQHIVFHRIPVLCHVRHTFSPGRNTAVSTDQVCGDSAAWRARHCGSIF